MIVAELHFCIHFIIVYKADVDASRIELPNVQYFLRIMEWKILSKDIAMHLLFENRAWSERGQDWGKPFLRPWMTFEQSYIISPHFLVYKFISIRIIWQLCSNDRYNIFLDVGWLVISVAEKTKLASRRHNVARAVYREREIDGIDGRFLVAPSFGRHWHRADTPPAPRPAGPNVCQLLRCNCPLEECCDCIVELWFDSD